jgi:hypothetical protein
VRLVGYNDLQGRESLVVTTLSDAANGSWVYVGHHESYWDQKPKLNPITGKEEWNGTSILNVADPANPKLVWHIPNDTNRNSRGVSVVYDYKFDGSGQRLPDSQSPKSSRKARPARTSSTRSSTSPRATAIRRRSRSSRRSPGRHPTPAGPGCGGTFMYRAHKGWWSQDTGYFYAASGEPGFRNVVIQIFDLKDPSRRVRRTCVAAESERGRAGLRRRVRASSGRR